MHFFATRAFFFLSHISLLPVSSRNDRSASPYETLSHTMPPPQEGLLLPPRLWLLDPHSLPHSFYYPPPHHPQDPGFLLRFVFRVALLLQFRSIAASTFRLVLCPQRVRPHASLPACACSFQRCFFLARRYFLVPSRLMRQPSIHL